jgi:hypothetical protein
LQLKNLLLARVGGLINIEDNLLVRPVEDQPRVIVSAECKLPRFVEVVTPVLPLLIFFFQSLVLCVRHKFAIFLVFTHINFVLGLETLLFCPLQTTRGQ